MKAWMSKFCFLLLTFCAQLWPILCFMFLSFRKDQPCGAWAFCMFFCWHVTQPANDYSSMVQPFKNPGISPHMYLYTYPFFQSPYVVYAKMPFHPPDQKRRWYTRSGHFQIGSTAISAVKREFNRFAKLKQIWSNPTVHAELSVRYWSTRTDFESYTCIVLHGNLLWTTPSFFKFLKFKSEGWHARKIAKVLLNWVRDCIKELDDACFLSDRCRHLIRFKNKLGEFCTKLACSQERALKHANEFNLENFVPWKLIFCTDWWLTWKNPVNLESRVWLQKQCYFATPQFRKTIYHCTFRFWHMTIFERILRLEFGNSFYNKKCCNSSLFTHSSTPRTRFPQVERNSTQPSKNGETMENATHTKSPLL